MLRSNVVRLLICALAFLTASCANTYAAEGAASGGPQGGSSDDVVDAEVVDDDREAK